MRFEHPEWVWLAVAAIAAGVLLVYWWQRRRSRALATLGSAALLERLTGMELDGAPVRRATLVASALGLAGLAVAGPQWGAEELEQETEALSIVLAVDVSESMWAEDVRPNRLERERLIARHLVREMAGHRIGLVAFAGDGFALSPLTVDHSAVQLYLDALDPTIASSQGSSAAAAIRTATEILRGEGVEGGDRAIVILSDGEAHDDREAVLDAARSAAAAGMRIYFIGIGTARGEPIPRRDRTGEPLGGYKRDADGEVVLTRLTKEPLAQAAGITDGFWVRADEGGSQRVLNALSELRRAQGSVAQDVQWIPRFQWFVGAALLLLLVDWAWAWRLAR